VQINAPTSITATDQVAAFASSGSSDSAIRRAPAVGVGAATPLTALVRTRRTLVSSTACRCPRRMMRQQPPCTRRLPVALATSELPTGPHRRSAPGWSGRPRASAAPARDSQPPPGPDRRARLLGRQGARSGPPVQPLPPDRLDARDRGLLQHHLADQHAPQRTAGRPPWQVTRAPVVPLKDVLVHGPPPKP
jgi:hypothetical protein